MIKSRLVDKTGRIKFRCGRLLHELPSVSPHICTKRSRFLANLTPADRELINSAVNTSAQYLASDWVFWSWTYLRGAEPLPRSLSVWSWPIRRDIDTAMRRSKELPDAEKQTD